jgi:Aspartyl protease
MNKLKILSVLLIALLSQIIASPQKKPSVELPMKSRGLMPAVEVVVNGRGPFLFAIDTGAGGRLRVDSSLVARLGLKVTGEAHEQSSTTPEIFTSSAKEE